MLSTNFVAPKVVPIVINVDEEARKTADLFRAENEECNDDHEKSEDGKTTSVTVGQ